MLNSIYLHLPPPSPLPSINIQKVNTLLKNRSIKSIYCLLNLQKDSGEIPEYFDELFLNLFLIGIEELGRQDRKYFFPTFKLAIEKGMKGKEQDGMRKMEKKITTVSKFYYRIISQIIIKVTQPNNKNAKELIQNLKDNFFKAFLPKFGLVHKQQADLIEVIKEIFEGVSQTLYYELFIKAKQLINQHFHCLKANTVEQSRLYIHHSYVQFQTTNEYIFKWIGLYYHMVTLAKMRQYHLEEEKMKKEVAHQLILLFIKMQDLLPILNSETCSFKPVDLFHAMIKWNTFSLVENLSVNDELVLKRKNEILCNLLAKALSYIEKQENEAQLREKYIQYYYTLLKIQKGNKTSILDLIPFYPDLKAHQRDCSHKKIDKRKRLHQNEGKNESEKSQHIFEKCTSSIERAIYFALETSCGNPKNLLNKMQLKDLIEFYNFNIKVIGNRSHLFILYALSYLAKQFQRFNVSKIEKEEQCIYISEIVLLLRVLIHSVSKQPLKICLECETVNKKFVCKVCNSICLDYECEESMKEQIWEEVMAYSDSLKNFVEENFRKGIRADAIRRILSTISYQQFNIA